MTLEWLFLIFNDSLDGIVDFVSSEYLIYSIELKYIQRLNITFWQFFIELFIKCIYI